LVEARGFRVLHAYVDGLWIEKPGARTRPDYEGLLDEIGESTGLHIGLEGVYRWVAFLPSRTEPRVTVANRYFGAFEDGRIKVRGIEARRRDTPPFIKQTQMDMLAILAEGQDAAGFRAAVPAAVAYAATRLRALRAGGVPCAQLVVRQRLTRQVEEYRVRTAAARVAQQLTRAGASLNPGESLRFLYVPGPEKAQAWELVTDEIRYDRQAYTELLLRAMESVLAPVGVDRASIETWLLGMAGYWGPPGTLPPQGLDIRFPLLAGASLPGGRAWRPSWWSGEGLTFPALSGSHALQSAMRARAKPDMAIACLPASTP
jgi:DNA polymerase-2